MKMLRSARSASLTLRLLPWVAGLLVALVASEAAKLETKWVVYLLVAQAAALVAALSNVRRWLLIALPLTLQLNVHYFFETAPPSYLGNSGPNYLSIVLVTFPAAALFLYDVLGADRPGRLVRAALRDTPSSVWALLAAMLISTSLSGVRKFGIYATVEYLQFVLLFVVAASCVRSKSDLRLVVGMLLVVLGTQSAVAVTQSVFHVVFTPVGKILSTADTGFVRVTGTVGTTPSSFGAFLEPLIYMATALMLTTRRGVRTYVLGALIAAGTVAALMTVNRTTWASLPVGFFLVFTLTSGRTAAGFNVRRIAKAAAAGALVVLLAFTAALPLLNARLESADTSEDFQTRLSLMDTAFAMIRDNPIFGVGPGGYTFFMSNYASSQEGWKFIVHNEYLLIWADIGTVGLLAWLWWYLGGLRRVLNASRVPDPWISTVAAGWLVGLVLRLWYWMLWSSLEFCAEALAWLLFGLAVAAMRIARADRVPGILQPQR